MALSLNIARSIFGETLVPRPTTLNPDGSVNDPGTYGYRPPIPYVPESHTPMSQDEAGAILNAGDTPFNPANHTNEAYAALNQSSAQSEMQAMMGKLTTDLSSDISSAGGLLPFMSKQIDNAPSDSPFGNFLQSAKSGLDLALGKLNPGTDKGAPVPGAPIPTSALDYYGAPWAQRYGMDRDTAYQEALANSAHQRQVQDMLAAGLNPSVIYRGSGGSGAGAFAGSSADFAAGSAAKANSGFSLLSLLPVVGAAIGGLVSKSPSGASVGLSAGKALEKALD